MVFIIYGDCCLGRFSGRLFFNLCNSVIDDGFDFDEFRFYLKKFERSKVGLVCDIENFYFVYRLFNGYDIFLFGDYLLDVGVGVVKVMCSCGGFDVKSVKLSGNKLINDSLCDYNIKKFIFG